MRNIDNCFPITYGKCTLYEGALFPETVNYKVDSSVDEAIDKLTKYVASIVEDIGTSSKSDVDISSLSSMSSTCSSKLTDTSMKYFVQLRQKSVDLSFNLSETAANVPDGFSSIKSGAEIVTNTSNVVNLRGDINGVSLSPQDFPLNVKFYHHLNTPCGLIELIKSVKLPAIEIDVETDFTVNDFGDDDIGSPKSVSEAVKTLAEKLAALDRKVDNKTKTIGDTHIADAVVDLQYSTKAFEKKIDNTSYVSPSDVNDLVAQVNSLTESMSILQTENLTIKTELAQLKSDIDS